MIKLGTVGTSAITESFLAAVALTGRFEHYAVYSRSLDTGNAFAKKQGAKKVFCDLAEMAGSGIDAVYIASPNVFHADQSRIFLEHGVHVICEKPIATSYADYCELKALADSKGLIYMDFSLFCRDFIIMVVSKTIKIISPNMPPNVEFIESEIEKQGIEALRWAIVEVNNNELVLCVSGRILNNVN